MRISVACGLFALLLVAAGCSDSGGGATPTGTGGAGGSNAGSGGSGGSSAGTGGSSSGSGGSQSGTGGSGGVDPTGSGGSAGVDAGGSVDVPGEAGGGTGGGAGGTDGGAPGNFSCTLILGAGQTLQWYNGGGFEAAVGTAKWEIKATDNTFTEVWANAGGSPWSLATASACTTNATTPDRVVLIVYSHTLTAQMEWETQIGMAVTNIKTKYPSAKAIELLSFARGPNNMMCGTSPYTATTAAQDMAMQAVADKSAGMVKVGPKYFVPTCAAFAMAANTNLTPAGAMAVAQMLVAAYK
ncbi:MAG TPA: hypothetical protein VFH73_06415 [Polyangia bacterium]|jgi:hypothetical protein|nr:hypothetical protein [Polyangia bacterium]